MAPALGAGVLLLVAALAGGALGGCILPGHRMTIRVDIDDATLARGEDLLAKVTFVNAGTRTLAVAEIEGLFYGSPLHLTLWNASGDEITYDFDLGRAPVRLVDHRVQRMWVGQQLTLQLTVPNLTFLPAGDYAMEFWYSAFADVIHDEDYEADLWEGTGRAPMNRLRIDSSFDMAQGQLALSLSTNRTTMQRTEAVALSFALENTGTGWVVASPMKEGRTLFVWIANDTRNMCVHCMERDFETSDLQPGLLAPGDRMIFEDVHSDFADLGGSFLLKARYGPVVYLHGWPAWSESIDSNRVPLSLVD